MLSKCQIWATTKKCCSDVISSGKRPNLRCQFRPEKNAACVFLLSLCLCPQWAVPAFLCVRYFVRYVSFPTSFLFYRSLPHFSSKVFLFRHFPLLSLSSSFKFQPIKNKLNRYNNDNIFIKQWQRSNLLSTGKFQHSRSYCLSLRVCILAFLCQFSLFVLQFVSLCLPFSGFKNFSSHHQDRIEKFIKSFEDNLQRWSSWRTCCTSSRRRSASSSTSHTSSSASRVSEPTWVMGSKPRPGTIRW